MKFVYLNSVAFKLTDILILLTLIPNENSATNESSYKMNYLFLLSVDHNYSP